MTRRTPRGLSLIELMMAMFIGLLVGASILAVFMSADRSSVAQAQLARLQEEGRFAITRIQHDLIMSGAQYCTNTGGDARATAAGIYLDGLRAPTVLARDAALMTSVLSDVTTPWGHGYPSTPEQPYSWPSFLAMRGYDCTESACTPVDPSNKRNPDGFGIPAMGTAINSRVVGASVLTVRYLDPSGGWMVTADNDARGSKLMHHADGSLGFALDPQKNEPAPEKNAGGVPLMMLADCSGAQVFAVAGQGTKQIISTGANFIQPFAAEELAAPKLFDLTRDMRTVTYYLKVVDNGDGQGHTTGALIRRVNGGDESRGGSAEEMARGVERMDFRYGVQRADGTLRYASAAQIDRSTGVDCPRPRLPIRGSNESGCLWRSVSLIEIDLLIDGQQPLYTLRPDELAYPYAADGLQDAQSPDASDRNITPAQQGFPTPMLRREFTAVAAVRNFNP